MRHANTLHPVREATLTSCSAEEWWLTKGQTFAPPVGDDPHLCLVVSGEVEATCGSEQERAKARTFVSVGPWTFSAFACSSRTARLLVCRFPPAWLPAGDILLPWRGAIGAFHTFRSMAARLAWEEVVASDWPHDRDQPEAVELEARLLLLLRTLRGDLARRPNPHFDWLEAAHARLAADFRDPPLVTELARDAGVERRKFVRLFRARYGLTPLHFIRERRVRAAQDLLDRNRAMTTGKIAVACGFHHRQQMDQAFRITIGAAPVRRLPVRRGRRSAQ